MTSKCETCLNSRTVVSENGYHPLCVLHWKKAAQCIGGTKDYYVKHPMFEDKDGYGDV